MIASPRRLSTPGALFDFRRILVIIPSIMAIRVPSVSRRTIAQTLGGLSPMLLVSLTSSLAQALSSGVSSSRALAAALQAAGLQRLRGLEAAAPRVRTALDKLASRLPHVHLDIEEVAALCAVLEYYIGLILEWLNEKDRQRHPRRLAQPSIRRGPRLPHHSFIPLRRAHRTRIGVLLPPIPSAH